jgi:hypothetical protein
MKDPLDDREDAYQRFNEEAKAQGKPPQVGRATKPMDVRKVYGALRARTSNPAGLAEARDKLTLSERRLEEDIFFYWIDEQQATAGERLEEPAWEGDEPLPVPNLPINCSFLKIVTGVEDRLLDPLRFRDVKLTELARYDEARLPPAEIVFEK